jgi:hypothetical protein
MDIPNVAKIDGSPVWSQQFKSDGSHLTAASGKVYVESLIADAEAFFTEVLIDLEKEPTEGTSMGEKKDPIWIAKKNHRSGEGDRQIKPGPRR